MQCMCGVTPATESGLENVCIYQADGYFLSSSLLQGNQVIER